MIAHCGGVPASSCSLVKIRQSWFLVQIRWFLVQIRWFLVQIRQFSEWKRHVCPNETFEDERRVVAHCGEVEYLLALPDFLASPHLQNELTF